MEVHYDVEGNVHKDLTHAIGGRDRPYLSYKAALNFAYTIGEYTLDRRSVLVGLQNQKLLTALDQYGYCTK